MAPVLLGGAHLFPHPPDLRGTGGGGQWGGGGWFTGPHGELSLGDQGGVLLCSRVHCHEKGNTLYCK